MKMGRPFLIEYFGTFNFQKGYNATRGGDGAHVQTDEERARRSATMTGRKLSEAHKQRLREGWQHRAPASAETLEKKRLAMLGRTMPLSEDARQRISLANKGKHRSEEARARMSAAQKRRWSRTQMQTDMEI